MNLKIPDLECCFACQLPRKSQPVCHAAPEKRWAATRRLNVGIQSEDSEDEWMDWMADLLLAIQLRILFAQCSSISWSCLSKKAWESATIHPFSLSICTVLLATYTTFDENAQAGQSIEQQAF